MVSNFHNRELHIHGRSDKFHNLNNDLDDVLFIAFTVHSSSTLDVDPHDSSVSESRRNNCLQFLISFEVIPCSGHSNVFVAFACCFFPCTQNAWSFTQNVYNINSCLPRYTVCVSPLRILCLFPNIFFPSGVEPHKFLILLSISQYLHFDSMTYSTV